MKSSPICPARSQALRETPPPAQRGFTQADQVNQLVSASEADADLGFMGRTMALCSLPRTNPGNRLQYKRVNGPFKLIMTATGDHKLPFGNLPRLILAWVSTEAVRTQSRDLVLGRSLSKFMRSLGINSDSGGARGEQTRLRNQMKRLFGCTVSLIYQDECGETAVNSVVARRTEFWWNERKPDELSLWESKIELGEDLFNEIISHPVPLNMNTLTALKRSPLGLDLYLWLVYRTFPLRAPLRLLGVSSTHAAQAAVPAGIALEGEAHATQGIRDGDPPAVVRIGLTTYTGQVRGILRMARGPSRRSPLMTGLAWIETK